MNSPSWFVCRHRTVQSSSKCPLVQARLELGDPESAVELGIATPEHVEVDAVEDENPHNRNLRDQGVEDCANDLRLDLDTESRLARSFEQDEPRAPIVGLLVTGDRSPRGVAVDRSRNGAQNLLDPPRVVLQARDPECGEEPERDGMPVGH